MNTLKLFRWISFLEGISYLILLGIAVPLKYAFDMPQMVKLFGMPHGLLFIAYIIFAVIYKFKAKWEIDIFFFVVIGSVIPFGTFYIDKKYLREIKN